MSPTTSTSTDALGGLALGAAAYVLADEWDKKRERHKKEKDAVKYKKDDSHYHDHRSHAHRHEAPHSRRAGDKSHKSHRDRRDRHDHHSHHDDHSHRSHQGHHHEAIAAGVLAAGAAGATAYELHRRSEAKKEDERRDRRRESKEMDGSVQWGHEENSRRDLSPIPAGDPGSGDVMFDREVVLLNPGSDYDDQDTNRDPSYDRKRPKSGHRKRRSH